jgi:UDP-N-acetylglucosamine 1-carboxyvinyltransferase
LIIAEARQLRGDRVSLLGPQGTTVTGTCNVLTAATLASGTTVIEHAAREPEVVDLANFLNACGARISGHGTSEITVEGVPQLRGTTYRVIPDRIEAGTLLCAAAITGGDVTLTEVRPDHLEAVLQVLRATGCRIAHTPESIRLTAPSRILPVDLVAQPYPAFPTDLQPQLTALLSLAAGASRVVDEVFPERFAHVPELCRLGAQITQPFSGCGLRITGRSHLNAAPVSATDLRGGAALVLAALAARGTSSVAGVAHIDRGYQQFEASLGSLRARLFRHQTHLPATGDLIRRTA